MRISDWSSDVCSSDLLDWSWARYCAPPTSACALSCSKRFLSWMALATWPRSISLPQASKMRACTASAKCSGRRKRSEEHTSELQSLMRISYAVFCLKKKKEKKEEHTTIGIRL